MTGNGWARRASVVLLCAPAFAQAQQVANTHAVEEIEVWSTQIRLSETGLDGGDIELRQADHVSDLLRHLPGVDVGGAHSLNQRITIRSLGDRNLRITIDGANQNTYMYHHMGNLQIHADILQSVDVAVGKNSVVNSGLGGAVRFETRQASDLLTNGQRMGARVQASYADNASTGYSLAGYGLIGDAFDYLVYFNQVERDNYEVGGGRIRAYDGSTVPGTDGTVRGLEGEVQDVLVRFGWDVSDNQRVKVGYERYVDEGDYSYRPDMGLATGVAIANSLRIPLLWPTEFSRDTYTLNHELSLGEHTTMRSAAFRNESAFWRDERGLASWVPDSATINEGEANNTGLNVLATTNVGDAHTLTYGLEGIRYDTAYIVDSAELASEQSTGIAMFIEDAIQLSDRWTLTPGLRFDTVDVEAAVVDDRFDEITGALELEFYATDAVTLRASGTQLFKAPELSEVFTGAGLFDEANPDLRAETGLNTEIGASFRGPALGVQEFSAGITLFRTQIDDYAYEYAETATFYGRDNVGDMEIDGVELSVGVDFGAFGASANYSRSRSDLDAFAEYAALDGARIDREQGDTLALSLDYAFTAIDLAVQYEALLVDGMEAALDLDGATQDNAKDSFAVHNVFARWHPNALSGLTVTVGVENLFDEYYASQSSRTGLSRHPRFGQLYLQDYEPGRNIKGTLSYRF